MGDRKYSVDEFLKSAGTFKDALFAGKIPCARGAFLNGIGAGVAMGGVWLVQSRMPMRSIGVAVKTFVAVGMASVAYCDYQRHKEIEAIKATVDALNAQQARVRVIEGQRQGGSGRPNDGSS